MNPDFELELFATGKEFLNTLYKKARFGFYGFWSARHDQR
jgi:hypothetical protein